MPSMTICCADIGSIRTNRFGWAALQVGGEQKETAGTTMEGLVAEVVAALEIGALVALGFEAPLFVPLAADPQDITSARPGEGNRPWSAGAGTGALAISLVESAWILRAVVTQISAPPIPYLDWTQFRKVSSGLFLWEAFVSGAAKGLDHVADARVAVHAFKNTLPNPDLANAVNIQGDVLSLIGAVLLRTGLCTDPAVLAQPCLVIRA